MGERGLSAYASSGLPCPLGEYYLGDAVYFATIDLQLPVEIIDVRVINPDRQDFLASRDGKLNDDE